MDSLNDKLYRQAFNYLTAALHSKNVHLDTESKECDLQQICSSIAIQITVNLT